MPAKGTTRVSQRQKAAIARGKLAEKTNAEIARDTGLKRSTVEHIACGPEVKGILNRIMVAGEVKLFSFFGTLVDSIEAEFSPTSKNTFDQRERARTQAINLLQLGQPKVSEVPATALGGGVFLGDMLTQYRSLVVGAPMPGGEK